MGIYPWEGHFVVKECFPPKKELFPSFKGIGSRLSQSVCFSEKVCQKELMCCLIRWSPVKQGWLRSRKNTKKKRRTGGRYILGKGVSKMTPKVQKTVFCEEKVIKKVVQFL